MEQPCLTIGLDVGTQSTKGVVLDASRRAEDAIVARASRAYDLLKGLGPGAAEQHPHTWRDAVREVLRELLGQVERRHLFGIGVSGQQHGLVVLDEHDEVIRPAKLWCDTTTERERGGGALFRASRRPLGFTGRRRQHARSPHFVTRREATCRSSAP